MRRMLARTGAVTALVAGVSLATGTVPAHAYEGILTVVTYYNNAQHGMIVGQDFAGNCSHEADWGTMTNYLRITESTCQIG